MNNDLLMQKKAKQRKFCLACTIFHHFFKENDYFGDFSGLIKSIRRKVNGVAKIHQLTKPIENLYC